VLPCFLYIFSELLLLNTEGYSYCRTLVYEILVTWYQSDESISVAGWLSIASNRRFLVV
jgi:hypothetical protein